MKIVQSLWTRPLILDAQQGAVSGGWPDWDHYWASWVLSAWQAHLTHGRVDLVTDRLGAQILVDGLGLPYQEVSLALDDIPAAVHPALWAYGKILAYEENARRSIASGATSGGGGFVHIDADVYLWKPLPERVTSAALPGVAAQHYEWAPHYPPFHAIYTRPRKTVKALMKHVPPSWSPHAKDDHAINMGLFGGTDLDTIAAYCREVRAFVEHPENQPGWRLIAESDASGSASGGASGGNLAWCNMLIEQQTAYCVARQRRVPLTMLFEKEAMGDLDAAGRALGYTHAMAHKRLPAADPFHTTLRDTVRARWPRAWRRITTGLQFPGRASAPAVNDWSAATRQALPASSRSR